VASLPKTSIWRPVRSLEWPLPAPGFFFRTLTGTRFFVLKLKKIERIKLRSCQPMKPNTAPVTLSIRNAGRPRGFTLVEVMVVISIIAVLALLVVVMTRRIKEKAYQAKALDPLKQASAACMSYSMENNSDIMTVNFQGSPRMKGKWVVGSFWGALTPHIFTGLSLKDDTSSASALKQAVAGFFGTQDRLMKGTFQGETHGAIPDTCTFVPFAFNTNVTGWDVYRKTSQYESPSSTLYMTYGWSSFSKKDGDKYAPLAKTKAERTNNIDWFSNQTAAFVFLDGHVEVLSPPIADRLYSVKPAN
jgi:prepilin-type N-terminal cleavage/methylation domain-containing protein/prepilin-type processing-associated H-X9-DG protein